MNRCRNCGAIIDDSQTLNFDGLCSACKRNQNAGVRQKGDKTFESGIWLIVVLTGILHTVGTIVVFYTVRSFTSQFGDAIFVPFIPVFALSFIFGVGITIIGYIMHRKTVEQQR